MVGFCHSLSLTLSGERSKQHGDNVRVLIRAIRNFAESGCQQPFSFERQAKSIRAGINSGIEGRKSTPEGRKSTQMRIDFCSQMPD
jgi:hypothetical protein